MNESLNVMRTNGLSDKKWRILMLWVFAGVDISDGYKVENLIDLLNQSHTEGPEWIIDKTFPDRR